MNVAMNWTDSTEMARMDGELSMLQEKPRQILYIQTETRAIVQRLINHSATLLGRLTSASSDNRLSLELDAKEQKAFNLAADKYAYMTDVQHQYCWEFTEIAQAIAQSAENRADYIRRARKAKIFYILDFHVMDTNNRAVMIKTYLDADWTENSMLMIVSPFLHIPAGFSNYIDVIYSRTICQDDIRKWITDLLRSEKTAATDAEVSQWVRQLVGLNEHQIERVLHKMSNNGGKLRDQFGTKDMLRWVAQEREQAMRKEPSIVLLDVGNEHTVGLGAYSDWLTERAEDFRDPESAASHGTPAPKGALLMGVPGTGKTAMARETARCLGHGGTPLPLIRFEIDRLQSSAFGESESNLARLLEIIGSYSPVVMLIDEIEKTFHVDKNGEGLHEVKRKMLGTLLQWLQERKDNVFTFVTANDIRPLPPELLRDGRLDGRFFSFMPTRDELTLILCEKLRRLPDGLLDATCFQKIRDICDNGRKAPAFEKVAELFDEIARKAKQKRPQRRPFMTGANVVALLENTLRELNSSTNPPYTLEVLKDALIAYASGEPVSRDQTKPARERFRPQGQTNLRQIAEMWLLAWENQYESVSDNELLSTLDFENGKFSTQNRAQTDGYDAYMLETLRSEIEKVYGEAEAEKAVRRKVASEQA